MRLPRALCTEVGRVLGGRRSHTTLDLLFATSGAPGAPPGLAHSSKWSEWLFRAGIDPNVDSLSVLGNVLEEFMDVPPNEFSEGFAQWKTDRECIVKVLEENRLQYFRGGRILPSGQAVVDARPPVGSRSGPGPIKPGDIDELLEVLLRGLRRAMHPLTHRRRGALALSFSTEYDVQDLLHALLRPWVADIRPEEFTPSYAGTSTRMDFLLPKHRLVIELKLVRDTGHAKKVGEELIIDIEHYRRHPECDALWCAVFDPGHLLQNAEGLKHDLEGKRSTKDGDVEVRFLVF